MILGLMNESDPDRLQANIKQIAGFLKANGYDPKFILNDIREQIFDLTFDEKNVRCGIQITPLYGEGEFFTPASVHTKIYAPASVLFYFYTKEDQRYFIETLSKEMNTYM